VGISVVFYVHGAKNVAQYILVTHVLARRHMQGQKHIVNKFVNLGNVPYLTCAAFSNIVKPTVIPSLYETLFCFQYVRLFNFSHSLY
jgi:hypothetical protein